MKELTVKQAIEQGYVHYVYNGMGYQSLNELSDMDVDFDNDPVLCAKELTFASITEDALKMVVKERISESWWELTADESGQVEDLIDKIDFSEMAEKINSQLKEVSCFVATEISLIEDEPD